VAPAVISLDDCRDHYGHGFQRHGMSSSERRLGPSSGTAGFSASPPNPGHDDVQWCRSRSLGYPAPPEVLEPRRQLDRGIGESVSTPLLEQALEGCRIVPPAPGVPHHDLEEHGPLRPGFEGAESGSLG